MSAVPDLGRKQRGMELAAARLAARLPTGEELARRCAVVGLPAPGAGVRCRLLGRRLTLRPPLFTGGWEDDGRPAHPVDRVLVMRYLLAGERLRPEGEPVAFRRLPGGSFYLKPFARRSLEPLVRHFGDDLQALRARLARYAWRPLAAADDLVDARIHVLGRLQVRLTYHRGEEGLPAEARILFPAGIDKVYTTEEAVALAARVCQGLAPGGCAPCRGCGMCE